tara:strand:- start:696 stop:851 length:156 start_codon:yes stop_codon:yes gene_type:complete
VPVLIAGGGPVGMTCALALVRPDQHLAWRGNAAEPDTIDTVRGWTERTFAP